MQITLKMQFIMLIPAMHKVFENFVFFDFFRFFENFNFYQKINIWPPAFHPWSPILMKFTSVVPFLTLIPKIFNLIFFDFFLEILIFFFKKSKKIHKPKIFQNSMHIWNQHEKLHWSCYLHQNRTNLVQFRKNTLKVKKIEKNRKN